MVKYLRENNEIKQAPLKCINYARLLTKDETECLLMEEEKICKFNGEPYWWWLCTASNENFVFNVTRNGTVWKSYVDNTCGVRPVLILDSTSSDISVEDVFEFGGHRFQIISNNLALCEDIIANCAFREDLFVNNSNDYRQSDVKKYVDDWFKECMQDELDIAGGRRPDSALAAEHDYGF